MELIEPDLRISFSLLLIYSIFIFFFNKWKKKYLYYPTLSFLFIVWLLNGRTIALFPNGKLLCGWYYIETERLYICDNDIEDCEAVFYYDTKYRKENFWNHSIKTKKKEITIFVGPFISNKVETLFTTTFPNTHR